MARRARPLWAAWAAAIVALAAPDAFAGGAELAYAKACRKAFAVQGRTYVEKRSSLLLGCADKLLKCELRAEIDGDAPDTCREAVTGACTARIGATPDSALSKVALRFDAKVGPVCQTAVFDYADVLSTGAGGLWFANLTPCASSIDLPSFLVCLRDQLDLRTDALTSSIKPRAGLLLDNVGLGGLFPHLVRPPFTDVVVVATAAGSGTLVGPGPLTVPVGNALRITGDATLACANGSGRLTITVGTGPTALRHTLKEPYGPDAVAIFGPWIAPASVAYQVALTDGTCQDTTSGTVSVP